MNPVPTNDSTYSFAESMDMDGLNCKEVCFQKDKSLETDSLTTVDLIMFGIFKRLNFQDLQTCSEVNKAWNRLARLVMTSKTSDFKAQLTVFLDRSLNAQLQELSAIIENAKGLLPWKTLTIKIKHSMFYVTDYENCQERFEEVFGDSPAWNAALIQHVIIEDMQIHHPKCLVWDNLARAIRKLTQLEKLTLRVKDLPVFFKDKIILERIKYLELDFKTEPEFKLICELLVRKYLPNLTELLGVVNQTHLPFFTDNDLSFLVKNCDFPSSLTSLDLDNIFNFAMDARMKLRRLAIFGCANPQDCRNIFEHVLELILANSEQSLVELRTNFAIIHFIAKIRNLPLPEVSRLEIVYRKDDFGIDGVFNSIPFSTLFPKLKTVHIFQDSSSEQTSVLPESFFVVPPHSSYSPCLSVSHVSFESNYLSLKRIFMKDLYRMFPETKHFSYKKVPGGGTLSPELLILAWHFLFTERIWPELESVEMTADVVEIRQMEPTIVGVHEDEVENWKAGVYGYLDMTRFQFPPARGSVFYRPNLTRVSLGYYNGTGLPPLNYAASMAKSRLPDLIFKRNAVEAQKKKT